MRHLLSCWPKSLLLGCMPVLLWLFSDDPADVQTRDKPRGRATRKPANLPPDSVKSKLANNGNGII